MGYNWVDRFSQIRSKPMLDINTIDARWTLLIGLPIIVLLLAMAVRRSRAVARRIREVKEDMARNPQNPYQALSELMAEREAPTKKNIRKETRRNTWRKG